MADPNGMWETKGGVSLVCFGKEDAIERGATMAGWTMRAIVGACVRSEARMDRDRRDYEQIE